MAQLTFTVPDAVVARIRAAFGHNDPTTGERLPASVAEVQATVKSYVKGVVLEYEVALQAKTARDTVGQEDWS